MLGLMLLGVQVTSSEIRTDLANTEQEFVGAVYVPVPTPPETTETFDPEVEQ
jgi:hypothetical protein